MFLTVPCDLSVLIIQLSSELKASISETIERKALSALMYCNAVDAEQTLINLICLCITVPNAKAQSAYNEHVRVYSLAATPSARQVLVGK